MQIGNLMKIPSKNEIYSKELKELYLKIMEESVTHFETLWTKAKNGIPNAGFYDFRKYGNWKDEGYAAVIMIPGNGMVSLIYAVLFKEAEKKYFSSNRIPRCVLLEHAIKVIRWCCLTSAYVDKSYPYLSGAYNYFMRGKQWIRRTGERVDAISHLMLAAALLWDKLDEDTRKLVRAVAIGCAVRGRKFYHWDRWNRGNHDQVAMDLGSTIAAAYMFPDHKDHNEFMDMVRGAGIDLVSTLQDKNKKRIVEGKSIKDWARGWNLYPDYSSDHGPRAEIYYGIQEIFEARALVELFAKLFNGKVPGTYNYSGNNFDGVLQWAKILFTDTGDLAYPHGVEYDSYYGGAAISAFSYGSTVEKDNESLCFENIAAELFFRHTQALKEYDYHRPWSTVAIAYLMHKYCGGRITTHIDLKEAFRSISGTYRYKYQKCFIHRTGEKWASFSWGAIDRDKPFCGLIIPQNPGLFSEPLIYWHPNSLTGKVEVKIKKGHLKEFLERCRIKVWAIIRPILAKYFTYRNASKIMAMIQINGTRFSEQCLDSKLKKSNYQYEFDETGFSTAGKVNWFQSFEQRQAVFSFQDGPCVILLRIDAIKDSRLEKWSGLPIFSYNREGMVGTRTLYYEHGKKQYKGKTIKEETLESKWFSINDQLGMAICGGNNKIRICTGIGFNWSRKESYRDKYIMISASPLGGKFYKDGENLVHLGVVICPNTHHEIIKNLSKQLRTTNDQLPIGWSGLIFSAENSQKYLTVVNFDSDKNEETINLNFPQGAPIFDEETLVEHNQAFVRLKLKRFQTIRQELKFFLEVPETTKVKARIINHNEIKMINLNSEPLDVKLKYFDKAERYNVKMLNEEGHLINQAIMTSEIFQNEGFRIDLRERYLTVKVESQ